MKNILKTLFLHILLCTSYAGAHDEIFAPTNTDSQREPSVLTEEIVDPLAPLRAHVTLQVAQIQNMFKTLCEAVQASKLRDKEQLCRELSLMCDCMQTIAISLPDMNKQALINLIELNTIVINQLQEQLIDGTINGLCNFTAAQFTTPKQQARSFVTIEQLQEQVAHLQNKIQEVWALVTSASLDTYSEQAHQISHSVWEKVKNNKATFITSLTALLAAGYLYKNRAAIDTRAWIHRLVNYSLMSLYILRQKKDADIPPIAYSWFGKESLLAQAMIDTKKFVGSPKEKLPAVHIIARNDMSLAEQVKWAEEQNGAVLKIEKGRDFNFIKNFFDLEDGLFKLPLSFFFAFQIKEDLAALSNYLDDEAKGFFSRLAHLINGKK